MSTTAMVFEALAADYDAQFTATPIGRLIREAVWRRLDARFPAGSQLFELGCGTGEDAVHLARRGVRVLATDGAPAMVDAARHKARKHQLTAPIEFETLTIESFAAAESVEAKRLLDGRAAFDGAFSNFGALNCVAELGPVARALAANLRQGAPVVLTIMGPVCPWEWVWFLGRGQPASALRRLRPGGVHWRGSTVHYPSIRAASNAFAPWFRRLRVSAVGALIPPTCFDPWARRHATVLAKLNRWERRMESSFPLPWLADHYVLELERR